MLWLRGYISVWLALQLSHSDVGGVAKGWSRVIPKPLITPIPCMRTQTPGEDEEDVGDLLRNLLVIESGVLGEI